jgi:hypothetical protein
MTLSSLFPAPAHARPPATPCLLQVEGPFLDENGVPTKETQDTAVFYDSIVSSGSSKAAEEVPGAVMTPDGLELTWTAKEGAYELCLDNTMSQLQSKVVEFSSQVLKKGKSVEDTEKEAKESASPPLRDCPRHALTHSAD